MMTPCGPGASGRPYRHTRAVGLVAQIAIRKRRARRPGQSRLRLLGSRTGSVIRGAVMVGGSRARWRAGGSADSWGEVRADFLRSGYASAANGSTVVGELALRPGFSPQARMPPTARCASRGGRRGLLVLTAGPVSCSAGVTHRPGGLVPIRLNARGVLALFLARGSNRGMGRREDGDANRT